MLQSCVGNVGAVEEEGLQLGQLFDVNQPSVANLSVLEVQFSQAGYFLEMSQSSISDSLTQIEHLEIG